MREGCQNGQMRAWAAAIVVMFMGSCSCDPAALADSGLLDSGTSDAGAPDAGVDGGALLDAGAPDAGEIDAGAEDSGSQDSGVDAGPDLVPPRFRVDPLPPLRPSFMHVAYRDSYIRATDWRRDEDPVVSVAWPSTDSDVDLGSVSIEVPLQPDGGGLRIGDGVTPLGVGNCDGGCLYFRIDGSRLPVHFSIGPDHIESRDAVLYVSASGADLSGNRAAASTSFYFTRYLWEWFGRVLVASVPALDPSGNLYVPTNDGFVSLTPFGETRWQWADGGPGAQPIFFPTAGGLVGFVQSFEDGGLAALRLLSAVDGTQRGACSFPGGAHTATNPVAVATTARRGLTVAFLEGPQPKLAALTFEAPDGGSIACSFESSPFSAVEGVPPVGINETACFASTSGVHCVSITDGGAWPSPVVARTVDPPGNDIASLAVIDVAGTRRILGSTNGGGANIFYLDAAMTAVDRSYTTTALTSRMGPLVVVRSPYGEMAAIHQQRSGDDGTWVTDLDSGTRLETVSRIAEFVHTVAGSNGDLHSRGELEQMVFRLDRATVYGGVPYYDVQKMFDAVDVNLSGTVDCNRITGRGGVFYAITPLGYLRAILISSPGIDTLAPWPKFQRDPANSGNIVPDLLPIYACP